MWICPSTKGSRVTAAAKTWRCVCEGFDGSTRGGAARTPREHQGSRGLLAGLRRNWRRRGEACVAPTRVLPSFVCKCTLAGLETSGVDEVIEGRPGHTGNLGDPASGSFCRLAESVPGWITAAWMLFCLGMPLTCCVTLGKSISHLPYSFAARRSTCLNGLRLLSRQKAKSSCPGPSFKNVAGRLERGSS